MSIEHRFHLEPYGGPSTRHTCPNCGQRRSFTRYVDAATKEYLADHVGKCDRSDKCGYHHPPREYFASGGERPDGEWIAPSPPPQLPGFRMTRELVLSTVDGTSDNALLSFLRSRLDPEKVDRVAHEYAVGTWTDPGAYCGATVFWQVDRSGEVRTGKVIAYGSNGHRIKGRTNWTHSLAGGIPEGYRLEQCLFGEHLLPRYPEAPVGIVESEKTALVARIVVPEILWVATGSLEGLTTTKLLPLVDRHVALWPDLGKGYEAWTAKASELEPLFTSLTLADALERIATPEQRDDGLDLADFLLMEREPPPTPPSISISEQAARAFLDRHKLGRFVHALDLDLTNATVQPIIQNTQRAAICSEHHN